MVVKKNDGGLDLNYNFQEILLSVVVPVYNVEPYLRRCLDSILAQDMDRMEMICVNDGSTDNSLGILQEYARKYACIHIINQSNGGLVSARKAGLRVALGKYISCIDSDDWIEQGMYAEMLKTATENDADVVTSGLIRDYGNHVVVDDENFEQGLYENEKLLYELKSRLVEPVAFFKSNIKVNMINKLYKHDILFKHQMNVTNEISIGEDAAVVYPTLLDAKRVFVTGKAYYHYCIRMDSVMGHPSQIEFEKSKLLAELLTREFDRHPEVINGKCQCKNLITYLTLMSYAPSVITYQDDYLSLYGYVASDDKLVVYGAGKLGQSLYDILQQAGLTVVAWADKKEGYLNAEDLLEIEFDKLLVAVAYYDMIVTIKKDLINVGIPSEKIIAPDVKKIRY